MMRNTSGIPGILLVLAIMACGWVGGQRPVHATGQDTALAAWERIATVLQHPRCLNCHQPEAPLQGDPPRPHVPQVVRGPNNHGVSAMRCGNCHNAMGNNETAGIPGTRHWSLPPTSMHWQDLSPSQMCRNLRNPALNGNRSGEDLLRHVTEDPLVLWAWAPGANLEPVHIPHDEFMDLLRIWIAGDMICP